MVWGRCQAGMAGEWAEAEPQAAWPGRQGWLMPRQEGAAVKQGTHVRGREGGDAYPVGDQRRHAGQTTHEDLVGGRERMVRCEDRGRRVGVTCQASAALGRGVGERGDGGGQDLDECAQQVGEIAGR